MPHLSFTKCLSPEIPLLLPLVVWINLALKISATRCSLFYWTDLLYVCAIYNDSNNANMSQRSVVVNIYLCFLLLLASTFHMHYISQIHITFLYHYYTTFREKMVLEVKVAGYSFQNEYGNMLGPHQ